jgi:hypothetical protein
MSELFEKTQIVQLNDVKKKIRLVVDGLEEENLWLTNVTGQVAPNFQILYSLGVKAYINAFSNRLGQFTLTGIYIPETCEDQGGRTPPFLKFYKEVQITNKKPAKMSYDKISIKGWAVGLNLKNYSQNNIDGHEFTISFLGRVRELQ